MPHLVMEYSDPVNERVNIDLLLEELHQYLVKSGEFSPENIKSRAYACHQWLIGEQNDKNNFIHLTLSLFKGRSLEIKKQLSQGLLAVLNQHASVLSSLTVEVREIEKGCYSLHP